MREKLSRPTLRTALFVLGGALAGLVYQRLVGCGTGTCIITSSPYVATAYGAIVGYFASGGARRRVKAAEPTEPTACRAYRAGTMRP